MTREQGRRRAAVLLILTAVLWFHAWLGQDLLPLWRRDWPPAPLVLLPLLVAVTMAYWVSDTPMLRKVMPLTLNPSVLSPK